MTGTAPSTDAVHAGVWATLGDARTTLALARAGFDWVGVDAQHGHFDDAGLRALFALRRGAAAPVLFATVAGDDLNLSALNFVVV